MDTAAFEWFLIAWDADNMTILWCGTKSMKKPRKEVNGIMTKIISLIFPQS